MRSNRRSTAPFTDWTELPLLLDPIAMARLLCTTKRAIYAQHQRGQLPPALDLGQRRLVWERDVVLAWLAQRRAMSP